MNIFFSQRKFRTDKEEIDYIVDVIAEPFIKDLQYQTIKQVQNEPPIERKTIARNSIAEGKIPKRQTISSRKEIKEETKQTDSDGNKMLIDASKNNYALNQNSSEIQKNDPTENITLKSNNDYHIENNREMKVDHCNKKEEINENLAHINERVEGEKKEIKNLNLSNTSETSEVFDQIKNIHNNDEFNNLENLKEENDELLNKTGVDCNKKQHIEEQNRNLIQNEKPIELEKNIDFNLISSSFEKQFENDNDINDFEFLETTPKSGKKEKLKRNYLNSGGNKIFEDNAEESEAVKDKNTESNSMIDKNLNQNPGIPQIKTQELQNEFLENSKQIKDKNLNSTIIQKTNENERDKVSNEETKPNQSNQSLFDIKKSNSGQNLTTLENESRLDFTKYEQNLIIGFDNETMKRNKLPVNCINKNLNDQSTNQEKKASERKKISFENAPHIKKEKNRSNSYFLRNIISIIFRPRIFVRVIFIISALLVARYMKFPLRNGRIKTN